jgi:hypothetical protein
VRRRLKISAFVVFPVPPKKAVNYNGCRTRCLINNLLVEQSPNRGTALFCWLFIVIGLALLSVGVFITIKSLRTEHWPVTEGIVRSAEQKSESGSDGGTTYSAAVTYTYQVGGASYTGEKVSIGQMSASSSYAQKILNRYPVGKKVSVHYAPGDPTEAVLETGIHGGTWICLAVGTAFALFGTMFLQIQRAAIKAQMPNAMPSSITMRPNGDIGMNQPPILMGVIFLLAGIGLCFVPPDSGKPGWLMYAVGGFFVVGGIFALLQRLKDKSYAQFVIVPFVILFLLIFNWVGFVGAHGTIFTVVAIFFDVILLLATVRAVWIRLWP